MKSAALIAGSYSTVVKQYCRSAVCSWTLCRGGAGSAVASSMAGFRMFLLLDDSFCDCFCLAWSGRSQVKEVLWHSLRSELNEWIYLCIKSTMSSMREGERSRERVTPFACYLSYAWPWLLFVSLLQFCFLFGLIRLCRTDWGIVHICPILP